MEKKVILAPDKGVDKYLPGSLIDDRAWADGNNVQFGVGYVKKVVGWRPFFTTRTAWVATTGYAEGTYVVPTVSNRHVYKCTSAGISGGDEPVWPTVNGGAVVDGTVTWTEVGVNRLQGHLQVIDNYYKHDGSEWLMFVTSERAYYYDETADTAVEIGALNGDVDHPAQTENAQDYFIITNGIDPVKYWAGTGSIADLPGLTDCEPGPDGAPVTSVRAKCVTNYNNFLILGDTTENGTHWPQRIRWSRLGDITIWKNDVEGNGQAGVADLTDGVDWVQLLRPLRSSLVVYKERSVQVLSYVGGDLIFDKRPAIIGTGLLAPHALCDLGDEHVFVGPDNFYSFDTIELKIAGDAVAKEFFRLLDPSKAHLTNSFFIEEVPETWFGFVSIDSPDGFLDRAIVYNTDTKSWAWRDAPMLAYGYYRLRADVSIDSIETTIDSWDTEIDSSVSLANAPINIAGNPAGDIFVLEGNTFDGVDIVSTLTSKLFDLDAPDRIKRLLRIQLMISREGPYNLPIYVGAADNVDEPVKLYGPYDMSLDKTYPPWIDLDISARYLCIKLGTVLKDEPFRLTGYILNYELRGDI